VGRAGDGADTIREYAASRVQRRHADEHAPSVKGRPLTVLDYVKWHRDTA